MAEFSAVLKREAACHSQLPEAPVSCLSCMQGKTHFFGDDNISASRLSTAPVILHGFLPFKPLSLVQLLQMIFGTLSLSKVFK